MNANALIVIAKYPEEGKVKTRLKGLTDSEKVTIYERLLMSTMSKLRSIEGVDTWIAFAPPEAEDYFRQFRTGLIPLPEGDLGERMHHAFRELFARGYRKVSLVGADIPDLEAVHILDSFKALDKNDLVFGPASDGGYYLVGMNRLIGEIFVGVPWSSSSTLSKSIEKAGAAGFSHGLIARLSDIDTIDDLRRFGLFERTT